jgi:hypothetical protein
MSDRGGRVRSKGEALTRAPPFAGEDLTMQYLFSVIDDGTSPGSAEEQAAIDVFNAGLRAEGSWVFAGGLGAPSTATVIDARAGEAIFTDGPYVETKEHLVGFWIVEAADLDVALKLAAEGSKACHRKVEVRPFQ